VRILVIEDNKRLRESVVQGLHENSYAVDATGDGEEALLFASVRQYDVVLLDLMLPGMNGYAVLETLRDGGNAVAILIMTARDAVDDRVKGLDLGADDYLVKPFALEEPFAESKERVQRSFVLPIWKSIPITRLPKEPGRKSTCQRGILRS